MVAEELQTGNEENTLLQDSYEYYDDDDDYEEALSLCDLPISSDYFSKEDGKNSEYSEKNRIDDEFDVDDDNLFEFFSEEFTASTTSTREISENIVFCGKLIPFKDHHHHHQHAIPQNNESKINRSSIKRSNYEKKSFACDYTSMGKVSLVRSATKSRWFLFMFGMSRLSSNQMQLSDIRNRQSRREPPAKMFPAPESGKTVVKAGGKRKKNSNGMWRMFRSISLVLGCSSSSKLANDVVKAAFV